MTTTYLAIDPGAGNIKAYGNFEGGKTQMRSVVEFVNPDEHKSGVHVLNPEVIHYVRGSAQDLTDKYWLCGDAITAQGKSDPKTAAQDANLKLEHALVLTLGCLIEGKIIKPGDNQIVMIMSHHNPMATTADGETLIGEELVNRVGGAHEIVKDGKTYRVQIKFPIRSVFAEGSAIRVDGEAATLDIGELTVLLTKRFNGSPLPDGTTRTKFGVGSLIDMLVNDGRVAGVLGGVPANRVIMSNALIEAIKRPEGHAEGHKIYYRHPGKAFNITKAYKACLQAWCNKAIAPALEILAEKQGLDYRVVGIGGGVHLPLLAGILQKRGIVIPDDCLFANVHSLYRHHLLPALEEPEAFDQFEFLPFDQALAQIEQERAAAEAARQQKLAEARERREAKAKAAAEAETAKTKPEPAQSEKQAVAS